MAICDDVHREYDRIANGQVLFGELPPWTHVRGRVAWYVFQGPYSGLGDAWQEFMRKAHASGPVALSGPPGDVYVCDPADHPGDRAATMTTIFWAPLKE